MSVFEPQLEEKELNAYVDEVDQGLEVAHSRFVNGDGIYVGTNILRDFYKGKHWSYKKEGGGSMRTYNYCFSIVENMTAFLANESPEYYSVPRDLTDPIERSRSEGITQFLGEVHRINKLGLMFQKGSRIGSLTGVTFLFGCVWDDEAKAIRYWNIENPENIRPIWRDSNFTEMEGFINRYFITVKSFQKQFKKQLKEREINPNSVNGFTLTVNRKAKGGYHEPMWEKATSVAGQQDIPMVEVQEYYDDTFYMARVIGAGTQKFVVDFFKHDYGFVPGIFIPNIHLPGSGSGTSDIENVLDAQIAYNESKSNEEDIIRQVAFTALWGKNLDNYSVIDTGVGQIYNFNDEADLQAIPRSTNPMTVENFERSVQGDLVNLSGQNQALYPGGVKSVLASTGRALAVLMQGINNKVSLRKGFWKDAVETMNRNILILAEQKIPNAKILIEKNYRTEVFIPSVLLRDVTEEINKFNAKLQSMTTTQKNLGIPSPSEEQKLMKEELKDPIFGVEISRQPGLLQAVIQQEVQRVMQMNGGGTEENPELAIQTEEGAPGGEKQPMNTPQQRSASPTSKTGAVRAQGQRTTGVPVKK